MKLRYLAPVVLPLLAFGECGGPSVVVPLPEQCRRIENQQIPGFPEASYGSHRFEHEAALGDSLPPMSEALSLRAWVTRAQVTALDGATLDFVDDISVAMVGADGQDIDAATLTATDSSASVMHLQPTGHDLLGAIGADGTARAVLKFNGTLPAESMRLNLTLCLGGEAEYALAH